MGEDCVCGTYEGTSGFRYEVDCSEHAKPVPTISFEQLRDVLRAAFSTEGVTGVGTSRTWVYTPPDEPDTED